MGIACRGSVKAGCAALASTRTGFLCRCVFYRFKALCHPTIFQGGVFYHKAYNYSVFSTGLILLILGAVDVY